jgi:hypothetical protein
LKVDEKCKEKVLIEKTRDSVIRLCERSEISGCPGMQTSA